MGIRTTRQAVGGCVTPLLSHPYMCASCENNLLGPSGTLGYLGIQGVTQGHLKKARCVGNRQQEAIESLSLHVTKTELQQRECVWRFKGSHQHERPGSDHQPSPIIRISRGLEFYIE